MPSSMGRGACGRQLGGSQTPGRSEGADLRAFKILNSSWPAGAERFLENSAGRSRASINISEKFI